MSTYDTRLIRGIGNIAEGKYTCSRVGAEEIDVDEISLGYFRSSRVPWFVKVLTWILKKIKMERTNE